MQSDPTTWVELDENGNQLFDFIEYDRDDWSVYLRDDDRGGWTIRLDLFTEKVYFNDGSGDRPIFDIQRASALGTGVAIPRDRVEPVRGFGYVWRNFLGAQVGPLGLGLDREYGFENVGIAQSFEAGTMFRGSDDVIFALLDNGRVVRFQ